MTSNESASNLGYEWRRSRIIPWQEIRFEQDVGGGPGGQHANKTATRVTLVWDLANTSAFSDREQQLLTTELASRINRRGEVRVRSASERSVRSNREECLEIFGALVRRALTPRKPRVATRPTKGSKRRRLDAKKRRSETKAQRRRPKWD